LSSTRILIRFHANFSALALEEAFCIFGAVESRLLRCRVDFVTEGVQRYGDSTTNIFGELSSLRGFVDGYCSL
jgi:hypothetical protein